MRESNEGPREGLRSCLRDGKESVCCNMVPYENCVGFHNLMIVTSVTAWWYLPTVEKRRLHRRLAHAMYLRIGKHGLGI